MTDGTNPTNEAAQPMVEWVNSVPAEIWFGGFLLIWLLCVVWAARQSAKRGYGFGRGLLFGVFLGPFATSALMHVLPQQRSSRDRASDSSEPH